MVGCSAAFVPAAPAAAAIFAAAATAAAKDSGVIGVDMMNANEMQCACEGWMQEKDNVDFPSQSEEDESKNRQGEAQAARQEN